jgi:hypothetical protein
VDVLVSRNTDVAENFDDLTDTPYSHTMRPDVL